MWRAWGSRPVVGSSSSRSCGWLISALAIVSRRFMPPRQRLDRLVGALGQLDELEQLGRPARALRAGDVEVAPVDHEVLPRRSARRRGCPSCGTTPIRARMAGPSAAGSMPEDPQRAPPTRGDVVPIIRIVEGLAGAVGAEEAERLAPAHLDVDAVDRYVKSP